MSMIHTIQSSYQAVRKEFVTADATLTSYSGTSRPSDCFEAGPEVGGVGIIFAGVGSDTDTFSFSMHGYRTAAENGIGPAEFICSGTGALGPVETELGNGSLYADTILITQQGSWYDVPVAIDSGNDRICKVCYDFCGFKYLYVDFTAIGGTSMNAYVGYF